MADRAREIFSKLDTDNDGELTMEEFVEGYLRMQEDASYAQAQQPKRQLGATGKRTKARAKT